MKPKDAPQTGEPDSNRPQPCAGNPHFVAGHSCPRFRGYMEGAVESSYRPAAGI